jgi:hypothetical protein
MLMIMTDEQAEAALAPEAVERIVAQHQKFATDLRAAGKWVRGSRLRFGDQAITLRSAHGARLAVDGPFAETKEVLGGFYLIEASSKEEAIDWAKRLPLRDAGAIEVRPARTGAEWRGAVRGAAKFLIAFIANADAPLARARVFDAIDAHYEVSLELAAQGKFLSSRSLEPSREASTLRWRDGRHVVTDGPFAESKEFVAGYFLVACDSKSEAIGWAERLMHGSDACEVRPLWEGT